MERDAAESGPDPWDAQGAMFRASEKTAELPLPKRGENTAEFAASKTGQRGEKKKKKLAGLTLHQFTAYCYIFKVYKTIDHKQGNYFCSYLKPRGRR